MNLRTFTGSALALAITPALAQPVASDETITVTATRTPLALEDALAPVIVITGDELRRTATIDVAEALRLRAGIEIGRNGGPGQAASLFIRGTNSNHALVLVDGVRVNPGTLGAAALHNIRPHDIERIEVVKGPRSSLYGTEAIGGVVNIITRRATAPLHADAHVGGGSHATREAGVGAGGRRDRWSGGVRVDHLTTDGFPPQRVAAIERGHDNTTVSAHGGYDDADRSLVVSHRDARGTTEYLDFFLDPVSQEFVNSVSVVTGSRAIGPARTTLRLARATDEIHQRESADHAITRRSSADLQIDRVAGVHQWTGGLFWAGEETRAEVFGAGFDERPITRAAFAQYQLHGRHWQALLAARESDHDAFGRQATWNAEVGRTVGEAWRLTASAGTGFRAPNSTERFGFGGDPDLSPERSRSVELGVRGALDERSRVEWHVYENRISDLVTYDLGAGSLANIDSARIRGTELVWSRSGERWGFRQGFVLQQPVNLTTDEPLPRRARRSAQTSISFAMTDAVALGVDALLTGPRKDSGFSDDMIAGYALVNLTAQWAFAPRWSLDARVENVLDADYETALGFAQAGRSVFMRLRWSM